MLNYRSFSQVILCGRLGQPAKLLDTKSGKMLAFSVATTVSVKTAGGSYEQKTVWHDCISFGSRVDKLAAALQKGTVVCVQGSISYREVELKNGYKGKTAKVLVDDLQILSEAARSAAPAQQQMPADDFDPDDLPC